MSLELVAIFTLCTALAGVLSAYDKKLRELKKLQAGREEIEERARRRAARIIDTARDRAVEIINQITLDAGKEKGEVEEQLEQAAKAHLDDYKKRLQDISNTITEEVKQEAEDFQQALETETIGTQKAVAARLAEEYARVEREIGEYKQQRLNEIQAELGQVVQRVVGQVAGRALKLEDQADLIEQALEEAKKAHVI